MNREIVGGVIIGGVRVLLLERPQRRARTICFSRSNRSRSGSRNISAHTFVPVDGPSTTIPTDRAEGFPATNLVRVVLMDDLQPTAVVRVANNGAVWSTARPKDLQKVWMRGNIGGDWHEHPVSKVYLRGLKVDSHAANGILKQALRAAPRVRYCHRFFCFDTLFFQKL